MTYCTTCGHICAEGNQAIVRTLTESANQTVCYNSNLNILVHLTAVPLAARSSLLMATHGTSYDIPAEGKVSNSTTEDDREDDKTVVGHSHQHGHVCSSKLESEKQCTDELLFVAQLEREGRGFQGFGLGKPVVCLTGMTNDSPIVPPPNTPDSFDTRPQSEHANNT